MSTNATPHDQKDTKHRIMLNAAELFARDGYYKVSVREICDAAGVTKPVLYYYFADKEALLEALMFETNFHVDELKKKYFHLDLPLEEVLKNIVRLYIEFVKNFPHLVKFSALIQSVNVPQKIKDMKLNRYNTEIEHLVEMIKRAQRDGNVLTKHNPKIIVQNYIGTIILIVVEHIILENKPDKLEKELEIFVEFWIDSFLIK